MLSEEAVLCSHYAQLCNGIPRTNPPVVNWIWQILAACCCNASVQEVK